MLGDEPRYGEHGHRLRTECSREHNDGTVSIGDRTLGWTHRIALAYDTLPVHSVQSVLVGDRRMAAIVKAVWRVSDCRIRAAECGVGPAFKFVPAIQQGRRGKSCVFRNIEALLA